MASSPPIDDDFPMFDTASSEPQPMPAASGPSGEGGNRLLATIPIHLATSLGNNLHLHQFPLLTRPLAVPPSARLSGKRIKVRVKPAVGVWEMHVPVDRRKEVWNPERAGEHGGAREEGDREERRVRDEEADEVKVEPGTATSKSKSKKKGKGKASARSDDEDSDEDMEDVKGKGKKNGGGTSGEKNPPLGEVRMRSDKVDKNGDYFVGVMRDGKLHLHRISEIQQFRPTLTYLDVLARQKSKPATLDDGEEGDEPEPAIPAAAPKAREVVVSARGGEAGGSGMGQMTALRREMIAAARKEQKGAWVDLEWFDEMDLSAGASKARLLSTSLEQLKCTSSFGDILIGIEGLNDDVWE
ncbi:hypothetical protein FRB94_008290 [Tulasnella sp. JGI-2019a]|nr:hypothetical protein FRB94_008290 [Tulasnella sp. JGI-2019a]